MWSWGAPIKKAPGIAPGAGRWGSPTEEKANVQLLAHPLGFSLHYAHQFHNPIVLGSVARNAQPVKCLTT